MNFEQWKNVILEEHYEELEDGSIIIKEGYEEIFDVTIVEGLQKKIVMRKGRPTVKYINPNPDVYKIVSVGGKRELRKMSPEEKRNRRQGAKIMAKKNAQKRDISTKRRLQSMGIKAKK